MKIVDIVLPILLVIILVVLYFFWICVKWDLVATIVAALVLIISSAIMINQRKKIKKLTEMQDEK